MKFTQHRSLDAALPPIEEDLTVRMEALFERCPALYGFTVQDSSVLPELVVTDLGIFPVLGAVQCEEICNEIAVTLLDFLAERPAAKDMLRGRTIVRVLH